MVAVPEELLPVLQACVSPDPPDGPARARLVAGLRETWGTQGSMPPQAEQALATLAQSSEPRQLAVAAAKTLRWLMALDVEPEPGTAPAQDPPRSHRERRKAAVQRKQVAALSRARKQAPGALDQPVETLPGIGKASGQALRERRVEVVADLLFALPLSYVDERRILPIGELTEGAHQVTAGRVLAVQGGGGGRGRGRRMASVTLEDAHSGAQLRLVWFYAPPGLISRFPPGALFRVAGRVERFRDALCINHPTTERVPEGSEPRPGGIVPRYPEIPKVAPRTLKRAIAAAVERAAPAVPQAVPEAVLRDEQLPPIAEALRALHSPPGDLDDATLAQWNAHGSIFHRRLAFEEFFRLELSLQQRRVQEQGVTAEPLMAPALPMARVRKALGFELTSAQRRVVEEIGADLAQQRPMRRLLQGDVGSGKTAVAMLATAQAAAAGTQVAFMAPTEVLAEQHFRSLGPLSEALGLRAALVLGGARASHRRKTRKALAEGSLDLAIGTHALLSEGIDFSRLGLVIVDEQHRFGVGQRLRLVEKGAGNAAPHLLVMTATPIPRTLTLALHGDLSTSVIDELPPGRLAPVTRAYSLAQRPRALHQLERALESGGRAYVVCPTIEDSEELEVRSALATHAELAERFAAHGVGLMHGRLSAEEKQQAMEDFAGGRCRVLVATTIVEVGLDVPEANVILIEHAERFGLAQLHQLRGRVGRAGQRSACLLVHAAKGEEAKARIDILCQSSDGFRIAEEDLRIRGPGELFGRKQSGLPGFRFGDLRRDGALLERAREAARKLFEADPELEAPEHAPARQALAWMRASAQGLVKEEAG